MAGAETKLEDSGSIGGCTEQGWSVGSWRGESRPQVAGGAEQQLAKQV